MRRRAVGTALAAALTGLAALLLLSTIAGLALAHTLPQPVSSAVAARLPFWIAAGAFGGGLQVLGPGAERISMLNDGGLIGPLQGRPAQGAETLRVDLIPLPVTLLAGIVVAAVLRRGLRSIQPCGPAELAGCAALVAIVFAAAGAALALASGLDITGAVAHPGRIATPVGGAVVGLAAALAGAFSALLMRTPALAALRASLRAAGCAGAMLAGAGAIAAAIGAATVRLGVVDTLVTGDLGSRSLKALLGLLLGPTAAFDGALVGAGAGLRLDGHAFGFSKSLTITLADAVGHHPLLVFLPLAVIVAVLVAGLLGVAEHRPPARTLAGTLTTYVIVFAALGALARLACRIDLHRSAAGRVVESATVGVGWLTTVVSCAVAGALVALVSHAAGAHHQRPPVGSTRAAATAAYTESARP